MGNIHKSKVESLKGDPYIKICYQALETTEHLCILINYCKGYETRYRKTIHRCLIQAQRNE